MTDKLNFYIDAIAIGVFEAKSDNYDKPWAEQKPRYRSQLRRLVRDVLTAKAIVDREQPVAQSERPWPDILPRYRCPNCSALNIFLRQPWGDARYHVQCRICDMQGPMKASGTWAIDSWNSLPRREGWTNEPS